jgi:hypothetical protein
LNLCGYDPGAPVTPDGALGRFLHALDVPPIANPEETHAKESPFRPQELAELARLCSYLPVALRIAAERAASRPQMPLHELIHDLRDKSGLWSALSVDDDEEADAVRTVFAWSYRGLSQDAARLFRLLGLHPGPQPSTAAAAALAGLDIGRARHLLDILVGAHLIEQTGRDHYQFHDLLRAYSADQAHHLEPQQEHDTALHRLFTWYLHSANRAATLIYAPWARIELVPLAPSVVPLEFHTYDEAVSWPNPSETISPL